MSDYETVREALTYLTDFVAADEALSRIQARERELEEALERVREHVTHYPDKPLDQRCTDAVDAALSTSKDVKE